MTNRALLATAGCWLVLGVACATQHEVEIKPVEVKPIHITIDVNIKVDKALDNFFQDIDEARTGTAPAADETKPKKQ